MKRGKRGREKPVVVFGSSDVEVQLPKAARLSTLDDGQEVNDYYYIICVSPDM